MKRSGFARKPIVRHPKPPLTPLSEPSRGVIKAVGDKVESVPKGEYVRSEAYRRWTTRLACRHCGRTDSNQAAHPNSDGSGAGGGLKASDLLCFPLCSVAGNDCHRKFDNYELFSKEEMPAIENVWCASTQEELITLSQDWREGKLRALLRKHGVVK